MTLREFFESIQSVTETILLKPMDGVRALELENWTASNIMSWIFIIIGFVAFIYWMLQLKKFNVAQEEDRSQISHAFLGKDSDLERN